MRADDGDLDTLPPPLTILEARGIVTRTIDARARLRRSGRMHIITIGALVFSGSTWEQAIDRALAAQGR